MCSCWIDVWEKALHTPALSGPSHREELLHPPCGWDGVFCSSKSRSRSKGHQWSDWGKILEAERQEVGGG